MGRSDLGAPAAAGAGRAHEHPGLRRCCGGPRRQRPTPVQLASERSSACPSTCCPADHCTAQASRSVGMGSFAVVSGAAHREVDARARHARLQQRHQLVHRLACRPHSDGDCGAGQAAQGMSRGGRAAEEASGQQGGGGEAAAAAAAPGRGIPARGPSHAFVDVCTTCEGACKPQGGP